MLSTRCLLCAIILAAAAPAAPRVSVRVAPECTAAARCALAPWADPRGRDVAMVAVTGAAGKPVQAFYLSDGGPRGAELATDSEGTTYLLLEYGIGRGAGRITHLAVLRVTERLVLLRQVQLRYPLGPLTAAEYGYRVETPFGGGLSIELTRRFVGKPGTWHYPPPSQIVSIPPQD